MWQTKYASAVPKNLGMGIDFRACCEGDFLTGRPQSVGFTHNDMHDNTFTLKFEYSEKATKI